MTTRRDWTQAEPKRREGCRVSGREEYGCSGPVELAHTIGRRYDNRDGSYVYVHPNSVVPLCRAHHQQYDARLLSLLEWLTVEEQADAVLRVGLERARRRLTGQREDTP